MKKITLFTLLILMAAACAKKNAGMNDDDKLGLGEGAILEGEIELDPVDAEGLLDPAEDDDTETEAPVVCEPVDILTTASSEETLAGDDYHLDIITRNPCVHYACELVSGPDWLTMTGCRLEGTPDTPESLGVHENIQVRVHDTTDDTNADVLDFTLTVRDEPQIVPFVTAADSLQEGEDTQQTDEFHLTWKREEAYLRIEGHADHYETEIEIKNSNASNSSLALEPVEGDSRLFKIVLTFSRRHPPELGLSQDLEFEVSAHAVDDFGNEAHRSFTLFIHKNPCDTPMKITRIEKQIQDGSEPHETKDNEVLLGSEYAFLYEVTGGEGPYEWSFENPGQVEGDFNGDAEGNGEPLCDSSWRAGACGDDRVTENPNWREPAEGEVDLAPEDDSQYVLMTEFVYDENKDLPYDLRLINPIPIYDRVKITVRSPSCEAEGGQSEHTKTDSLKLTLPVESVSDIRVEQKFEGEIADDFVDGDGGNIQDYNEVTRLGIVLEDKRGKAAAVVEYKIDACAQDMRKCTNPKNAVKATSLQTDSVDEISKFFLTFVDWSSNDAWCLWDCDDDQLDYLLESLHFTTKYRGAVWVDRDNHISWQVTPDPIGNWLGSGGGRICGGTTTTFNCLADDRGTVTVSGSEMCVTGVTYSSGLEYFFRGPSSCNYYYRTYDFPFPRWIPRLRPDYGNDRSPSGRRRRR